MLWLIVKWLLEVTIIEGDWCWMVLCCQTFVASWGWWKGCVSVVVNDMSGPGKKVVVWVDFAVVPKEGVEGGAIGYKEEVIMGYRCGHRFGGVGVCWDRF